MYLGIEIGGTKLQLGVGPGNGTLAGLWRAPVEVTGGADGIRRQIVAAVPALLAKAGIDRSAVRGFGIGFGGPVDDATRTVIKSHQIEGWEHFPLADWMTELLGWPTVLGNDADVAGLAEALFGAGKGVSPVFYITIGSGIGGGLVIDGEVYRGSGRGAAEIGHVTIKLTTALGVESHPLEEIASGWAIAEDCRAILRKGRGKDRRIDNSLVLRLANGDPAAVTAQHVGESAIKGDWLACQVVIQACHHLAEGICHVITLLCPRRIVIGGGVSLMGEKVLFEPLRKLVADRVFKPFAGCYEIVPAMLGEEVVVHGALALAWRKLGGGKP